jgi:5-methylcytosine-specific restriction endonuclease McrA
MNFHKLTNANLISNFSSLVQQERKITAQVLECIAEIDRRKLYVEKGYSSLFDFLVRDHGYSPGAAMRRVDGARLLRELPDVAEKFKSGALTLSQANQIQRAAREMKKTDTPMSREEKQELILQVEHASKKETEKIIAEALDLPLVAVQKETLHRDESVTLTVTLSKEQMELLKKVGDLISHAVPEKEWAQVLTYLAQKEMDRRTKVPSRQEKRETTQGAASVSEVKTFNKRSTIPAHIRKRLLHPSAKCEYKNSDGKLCQNTRYLQVDHIKSVSLGGGNELENLQVLCGVHNRYKYFNGWN